mmetsp:Transcript_12849/g.46977  ORF Transcript_12849/g.46977 Transcript_12849/m.46977 type:complete len:225 (+) Transcript_12849:1272-1946(+)
MAEKAGLRNEQRCDHQRPKGRGRGRHREKPQKVETSARLVARYDGHPSKHYARVAHRDHSEVLLSPRLVDEDGVDEHLYGNGEEEKEEGVEEVLGASILVVLRPAHAPQAADIEQQVKEVDVGHGGRHAAPVLLLHGHGLEAHPDVGVRVAPFLDVQEGAHEGGHHDGACGPLPHLLPERNAHGSVTAGRTRARPGEAPAATAAAAAKGSRPAGGEATARRANT